MIINSYIFALQISIQALNFICTGGFNIRIKSEETLLKLAFNETRSLRVHDYNAVRWADGFNKLWDYHTYICFLIVPVGMIERSSLYIFSLSHSYAYK